MKVIDLIRPLAVAVLSETCANHQKSLPRPKPPNGPGKTAQQKRRNSFPDPWGWSQAAFTDKAASLYIRPMNKRISHPSCGENRLKSAPFNHLRADYVHPPNGREGNVIENWVGKNRVRADSTGLTGKLAHNKPGQKMVSGKKGGPSEHYSHRKTTLPPTRPRKKTCGS